MDDPIYSNSEEIILLSTERIFWHDTKALFLLTSGEIDVFILESKKSTLNFAQKLSTASHEEIDPAAEMIHGPLEFLFTVTAGQLLCPFPTIHVDELQYSIVLVATKKTYLQKLYFESLLPTFWLKHEQHVSLWLNQLAACDPFDTSVSINHVLNAPVELQIKINENILISWDSAQEHKRTLWLQVNQGSLLLGGMPSLRLEAQTPPFPVANNMWFQASKPACISLVWQPHDFMADAKKEVARDFFAAGLNFFNAFMLQKIIIKKRAQAIEEQLNLAQHSLYEKKLIQHSLGLWAHLFKRKRMDTVAVVDSKEPILQACHIIGAILQQPIIEGIKSLPKDKSRQIETISATASCWQREIFLHKNWWEKDCGPLLGFYQGELQHSFVALIPQTPGYDIQQPQVNIKIHVDATVEGLCKRAYMFYRSFPAIAKKSGRQLLEWALKGKMRDVGIALGASFLAMMLNLCGPIANQLLFHYVIPFSNVSLLWQLTIGLAITAIGTTIFITTREAALLRLESFCYHDLDCGLWQYVLKLPLRFFRQFAQGDLLQRLNGFSQIRRQLTSDAMRIWLQALFVWLYVALMLYYSPGMAAFANGLLLLLTVVALINLARSVRINDRKTALQGMMNGRLVQLILGMSTIKIYGAESRIFANWSQLYLASKQMELKEEFIKLPSHIFFDSITYLAFLLIFIYVYLFHMQVNEEKIETFLDAGAYTAFYAAFTIFIGTLISFSNSIFNAINAFPLWHRLKEIFVIAQNLADKTQKFHAGELKGEIRIEHLYFRYDLEAPYIHNDISLHAKPGEFIALVGNSGCGKSTLINLLLGFEIPEKGSIYYDHKNLAELDLQAVRQQIGAVLQNSKILNGTIRENITGGRACSEEEIMSAVEMSSFDKDLAGFPMGLETPLISGSASTLSSSQQQRLFLARALLGNPKILILDEAINALDNKTQQAIISNLEHLHVTRIVIAHRLSTVRRAHRIYVMEKGQIVQTGTFEELRAQPGLFASLVEKQEL